MPPIPPMTVQPDGSLAFRHAGVTVVLVPSHADRRRLRWWTPTVSGRAIAAAASTPRIAAAMAIAALGRA